MADYSELETVVRNKLKHSIYFASSDYLHTLKRSELKLQRKPGETIFFRCSKAAVILLPAHPASFAHKFYFSESQGVPGCINIADLSLKIVFLTHKFAVGTH